jgi:hypothetical protein
MYSCRRETGTYRQTLPSQCCTVKKRRKEEKKERKSE